MEGTSTPGSKNQEPLDSLEAPSFLMGEVLYTGICFNAHYGRRRDIYYTLDGSEPDPVRNPQNTLLAILNQ